MKGLSYVFSISVFFAVLLTHFPANTAYAEPTTVKGSKSNTSERQSQATPGPAPAEETSVKSGKSNSDNREAEPAPTLTPVSTPAPAEGTTVKSSKSNSSE